MVTYCYLLTVMSIPLIDPGFFITKYRKDAMSCVGQCNSLISVGKYNSIKVTYVNVDVSLTR